MRDFIDSGLPGVGPIRWGTHCCQFYETSNDLADVLVPYFKAGIDNNEHCMWVTCDPLPADRATSVLLNAVPDLDRRITKGQIEIVDYRDWYKRNDKLGTDDLLRGWMQLMNEALNSGYEGLRATGNTYFLEASDWDSFAEYESKVSGCFCDNRIVALCSYCTDKCRAGDVMDVVQSHEFALARRRGNWTLIESAAMKQAKEELRRANVELESRVEARTADLRRALADKDVLLQEVHHRVKNNLQIITSLLAVKSNRSNDPGVREAFDNTIRRITAMSLVHQALYSQEDNSQIEFAAYLEGLAKALHASFDLGPTVSVSVTDEPGSIDLNIAVPLGLIAAELMSNAFKHAFPTGAGHLEVVFAAPNGSLPGKLEVRDDGIGMGAADSEKPMRGAGLGLLRAIARQVQGELIFKSTGRGTTATLTFMGDAGRMPGAQAASHAGATVLN